MEGDQLKIVLGDPVQLVLIADRVDIVVLVTVEVVLDAFGLRGDGDGGVGVVAGLTDHPLARQADHLVLGDLQRAPEHGDHEHDDGDVVGDDVPPWL